VNEVWEEEELLMVGPLKVWKIYLDWQAFPSPRGFPGVCDVNMEVMLTIWSLGSKSTLPAPCLGVIAIANWTVLQSLVDPDIQHQQ
jgi:hypothetical protein